MPNVRPLHKKYGISKYAFRTAYSYCLQYPEWKAEIIKKGCPKKEELKRKINKVETTVKEATGEENAIYSFLLEYVTTEGATFDRMKAKGIPCERTYFYEKRRKFYCLMSKKID